MQAHVPASGAAPQMQSNPLMMLLSAMQSGGNPMQIMQHMAMSNPQMQQALPLITGKSPQQLEQTARNMAAQRGIDLDALSAQIRQMMPRR